jgi:hypothetical protein
MANRIPNNYIINKENKTAKIELRRKTSENMWAVIDLDDLEYVMRWTWYARYNWSNQKYYATHTVYNPDTKTSSQTMDLQYYLMNPNNDSSIRVDHISHDTLDNRRENLRTSTNDENTKHRKGKNANNQSGYRSVAYIKSDKKTPYHVQLMINGKNTKLGKFADVDEAGAYAKKKREELYGEFAGED